MGTTPSPGTITQSTSADMNWDVLKPFEGQIKLLAPGEALFRQGTATQHLFFVRAGRIRLVRHTAAGHSMSLHVASSGELFAEGALFSDAYHCDAVADIASEVIFLHKQGLRTRLQTDAALAMLFLERVTQQLHRARALAELRNIRSAETRTLQHLRLLLTPHQTCVRFQLPLTQVATELGLTHEAYYRCLAKLARDGLIERDGRNIRLLPDAF
jgi:CRP-like cAMP-binding protein